MEASSVVLGIVVVQLYTLTVIGSSAVCDRWCTVEILHNILHTQLICSLAPVLDHIRLELNRVKCENKSAIFG